jgi:hypothetical protein
MVQSPGRVLALSLKTKRSSWHDQPNPADSMKRLLKAPNLALATLWVDQLQGAGIDATVQRAYASSIVGEIPPDQALPEVWVMNDAEHARAEALMHEIRHRPHRHWLCHGCGESVEGPFDQCWNCGALGPPAN